MLRALLLIVHLAWGLVVCTGLTLGLVRTPREEIARRWHGRLLAVFVIRVRVEGAPLIGRHLTVANHVSWLDIPVLGSLEATRFVSKSEVREWPIAGWLAMVAGTFFLRRGKGGTKPLLERLVPYLRRGHGRAVVFPEGTTTDGSLVKPFHARLFAAAIEAECPVQPVTLQYGLSDDGENIAPFIGDDSLVPHIVRLLARGGLDVTVRFGPPLQPGPDRDTLAGEAETFVRGALHPIPWPSSPPVRSAPEISPSSTSYAR